MITHRIVKQVLALAIASTSVLAASDAGASPLPCVQRALDWLNSSSRHVVGVHLVAMHETGAVAYQHTYVTVGSCGPYLQSCLVANGPSNALVSTSSGGFPGPTISLALEQIPVSTSTTTRGRLTSGGNSYDFTPTCLNNGNMIVGDDQWGNHWTFSLQLQVSPTLP